jgi:hypothetical protein
MGESKVEGSKSEELRSYKTRLEEELRAYLTMVEQLVCPDAWME